MQNPLFRYRQTDFVEMMCPFFDAAALRNAVPLFHKGYETAIDLVWATAVSAWWTFAPCAIPALSASPRANKDLAWKTGI